MLNGNEKQKKKNYLFNAKGILWKKKKKAFTMILIEKEIKRILKLKYNCFST